MPLLLQIGFALGAIAVVCAVLGEGLRVFAKWQHRKPESEQKKGAV